MKLAYVLPVLLLAACTDDNASKQESRQIFAAATSAMTSAQARAVVQARAGHYPVGVTAPAELTIDFAGPCLFGGSVALQGSYADAGDEQRSAFDLAVTFHNCRELTGTIDGSLRWASEATENGFAATMDGGVDWNGEDEEASCDFDLMVVVGEDGVAYGGELCGYNVQTEIVLGN